MIYLYKFYYFLNYLYHYVSSGFSVESKQLDFLCFIQSNSLSFDCCISTTYI